MNKIKSFIKNKGYTFFTIILGIIIISIIYKLNDVSPLGKNSLLKVDFYHQYGPMLKELYNRIKNGGSLIYSFNVGLGIPFFRNYFNYLSSPINILILLFKQENLLTSYSFIIGLKSVLSAITCSFYIKKKFNTKSTVMIGISLLYAYSAYFTAYYWNIMWIDGMYMIPLITLGIENIINKNNGVIYTISLTYMLYTNYFIGYMLCIYSCIYFIAYLLIKLNKKTIKNISKITIKFAICSLISGLLLAFELIPMYEALTSTNATMGTVPTSQYYAFTFIEFLKVHLTGVNSTVFASDISNAPNISCGILSFALFILFILNNKIGIKQKIVLLSLLIFLLLSFYIAPLDYVWHAFHVPNDLPYRYSFIYSFILIIICSYSLHNIKSLSYIKVIISFIISVILITFVYISKYDNITDNMIMINYLLIGTYFLIYTLYHFYPKLKVFASFAFVIVCLLECIVSVNNNWNITHSIESFYADYKTVNNTLNKIKKNDNDLFYRIEKTDNLTLNDPAWYNYYGQETFSSMAYNSLSKLNYNIGMPGNEINSYYYKQNTPLYDMIFNIKYIIGKSNDKTRYKQYINEDGLQTYKFNYNIGLMFGVNKNIVSWHNNYINPIEYQNDFISYSANIDNVFHRLTLLSKAKIIDNKKETVVKYVYKNELDNIYAYTNNSSINYIIIDNKLYYKGETNINDISIKLGVGLLEYHNYNEEYIINHYNENQDIVVYVSYKNYLSEELDIYTIDNNKFIKAYDYYKLNEVKISEFHENYIKGFIKTNEKTTIFTSIPYDKGWRVFVNNKKINTFTVGDSLLAFDIPEGENKVEAKYTPNNLDVGISISITTLIFAITYLLIKKKKSNHQD